MAIGLDSLFQLQSMDPAARDMLMTNMGLQQSSQQGMDALLSQLAQQVMQAQGQQQLAESNYRLALQQPPPTEGPGEVTRSLFGNIASAVSGQPQFAQQAQAANARDLSSLMEARKERLAALHDQVVQRSELAREKGNLKLSTSLHQQAGQLERALGNIDKLQQGQVELANSKQLKELEHQYRLAEIAAQNAGALKVAETKTGTQAAETSIMAWANKVTTGQATLTQVPNKIRSAVVQYMDEHALSITDPRVRTAKAGLGGVENAINTMERTLNKIPAAYGLGRLKVGAQALGRRILQPKPAAPSDTLSAEGAPAVYESQRQFFKTPLSKLSGQVGVLTEKDVQAALRMLPSATDNPEVRAEKFKELRDFIQARYDAWLQAFSLPNAGIDTRARFNY